MSYSTGVVQNFDCHYYFVYACKDSINDFGNVIKTRRVDTSDFSQYFFTNKKVLDTTLSTTYNLFKKLDKGQANVKLLPLSPQ